MIGQSVAAELIKLRTLPAAWITGLVAVVVAVVVTAAASTIDPAADAVTIVLGSVAFLQVGSIVLGVVAVASEYGGQELRTTLTAVPNRVVSLAGKGLAQLIATTVMSVVALAAAVSTGWALEPVRASLWWVAGAAAYLVLVGMLAGAVTVVLRSLVSSLVVMLVGVVVASPLLGSVTDQARWLPDQAGRALFSPDPGPFGPVVGAAVVLAWVLLAGTAAFVAYVARDA
jgi:ABC-2 type transport system permease protein